MTEQRRPPAQKGKHDGPMTGLPQRRRLRLPAFDYSNPDYVYFVTLRADHLRAPFADAALAKAVVDALLYQRTTGRVSVYAYVLMPDHLHITLSPTDNAYSVSEILRDFKGYTTQLAWRHGVTGSLWQRSFYDHIARRFEDVVGMCQYVIDNPVRKGLVASAQEWPYLGMPDALPS